MKEFVNTIGYVPFNGMLILNVPESVYPSTGIYVGTEDAWKKIVEERAKDTAKKKSFQTRTSAGSSRADSGAKDIMSGIMAEAQRTAKLF